MEALGITKYNTAPAGADKDRISSETFCQEAYVHFIIYLFVSDFSFLYLYRKTRLNELNATFLVQ